MIVVTLKNNQAAGGRRQVQKTVTLTKPGIEALREACKDRPLLADLLNAVEEVATK